MQWDTWLDLQALKALSQHASAVIAAILLFALIGLFLRWAVPPGPVNTILTWVDEFVLVGLFLWFAFQLGVLLWNRRVRNGSGK